MATTTILTRRSSPTPVPTRRLSHDEMTILLDGYGIDTSILANPSPDPVEKVRAFLLGQSSEGWCEESIIKCYINTDREEPLEDPKATATTLHELSLVCRDLRTIANSDKYWKRLCDSRWKEKFGYKERMETAEQSSEKRTKDDMMFGTKTHFWKKKFSDTELDARRSSILPCELCRLSFKCRPWTILVDEFDYIVPSALDLPEPSGSGEIRLERKETEATGRMIGHPRIRDVGHWLLHPDGKRLYLISHSDQVKNVEHIASYLTYFVKRMDNWGWEIGSNCEVWRSIDTDANVSEMWEDYTENLSREPIPEIVKVRRGGGYASRTTWEIPNNEDVRALVAWW